MYGTPRPFNRFCNEIPFSNENIKRLSDALMQPEKRSSPKHLRSLDQDDIHGRADKFIEVPMLENWLDAVYNYGTILKEKPKDRPDWNFESILQ